MTADPSRVLPTQPHRWAQWKTQHPRLAEAWGLLWISGLLLAGAALLLPVAEWFDNVWASQDADEVRVLLALTGLAALVVGVLAATFISQRNGARRWLRWYVMLAELRRRASDNPDERAVVGEAVQWHRANRPPGRWEEKDSVVAQLHELEAAAIRDAVELLEAVRRFQGEFGPPEGRREAPPAGQHHPGTP